MSKLGRKQSDDNDDRLDGGGAWPAVASLAVAATAMTVTAIFTHSVELAALATTLLRPR